MGAGQNEGVLNKADITNSHPLLQKSAIVEQAGKRYIQSSFKCDQSVYNSWRADVGKVSADPHSAFAYLPTDLGFVENNGTCTKGGYSVANYPEYPYILSDEIKNRSDKNTYFKEKELYYLLYALTASKADAQGRGEVLGDVKPENVFLNRHENVKIATLHSFPNEKTGYAKLVDKLSPSYKVLLAPEDLKTASSGQLGNLGNHNSEMFSMGATILSAGLLDDLSSIYDYGSRKFNYEEFTNKTNLWQESPHYSQIFKSLVMSMINPNPDKRIDNKELWGFVSRYESNIKARESFMVNNPPESIEAGVSAVRESVLRSRMS